MNTQQPTVMLRWVKASERLPENEDQLIIKITETDAVFNQFGYYDTTASVFFLQDLNPITEIEDFNTVEWLEEYITEDEVDEKTMAQVRHIRLIAAEQYSKLRSERVCNGQFPIEYTREQVVKMTHEDFMDGVKYIIKHAIEADESKK